MEKKQEATGKSQETQQNTSEENKQSISSQSLMKAAEAAPLLNEPTNDPKPQGVPTIKKYILKRKAIPTLSNPLSGTENSEAKTKLVKKEMPKEEGNVQETKRSKIEPDETMEAIINAGINASINKAEIMERSKDILQNEKEKSDSKENIKSKDGTINTEQKSDVDLKDKEIEKIETEKDEVKEDIKVEVPKDINMQESKPIEDTKEHVDVEMTQKELGKITAEAQDLTEAKAEESSKVEVVTNSDKELSKDSKQEDNKLPGSIISNLEQPNVTSNQDNIKDQSAIDTNNAPLQKPIEEHKQKATIDANKQDSNTIEQSAKIQENETTNKGQVTTEDNTMKQKEQPKKEETNKQQEVDQSKDTKGETEEAKGGQKKIKRKLTDVVAEFEEFLNKEYSEKYEADSNFDAIIDVSSLDKIENTFGNYS